MQNYNVKNIFVNKDKTSDFLEFYQNDPILSKCPLTRAFPSGAFYIFTLDNVHDEERQTIRDHQDEWM